MKTSTLLVAAVFLSLSVAATTIEAKGAERAQTSPGTNDARASKAFPTVAKNQTRPARIHSETDIDPDILVPPDEPGTGATQCLRKHKCTGGAICASGSCTADETANGCKWCTGFKCKAASCL